MTKEEIEFAENGDRMMYETIKEQRHEIESLTEEVQMLKKEIVDRDCIIAELKNENAELKENIGMQASLIQASFKQHEKDTQRLTKAKYFLITTNALLETFNSCNGSVDKLIIDIKQFLSEVVGK